MQYNEESKTLKFVVKGSGSTDNEESKTLKFVVKGSVVPQTEHI
jgi:hypothetical protein